MIEMDIPYYRWNKKKEVNKLKKLKEWIKNNNFIAGELGYIYGVVGEKNLLDKIKELENE